jgi:hypothetical protein
LSFIPSEHWALGQRDQHPADQNPIPIAKNWKSGRHSQYPEQSNKGQLANPGANALAENYSSVNLWMSETVPTSLYHTFLARELLKKHE